MWKAIKYGINNMCSRPIYMVCMIGIPLFCTIFFLSLFWRGMPTRVPTAIVDLDHSPLSRQVTRTLGAQQFSDIVESCESYHAALEAVRQGRVYGFFMIPENFQQDAIAGRRPTINYYANMTYFVAGTFSMKSYKTVAVTTASALLSEKARAIGVPAKTVEALIQPMTIDVNPIHNPWTNYSVYLTPSFMGAVFALMVVMVTIFTLCMQIKNGTSPMLLRMCGGSIVMVVTGLILPQTVVFSIVGWCTQSLMYGFSGFPMYGSIWLSLLSMFLLTVACQGLGILVASTVPHMRFALSIGALVSILAFSFTGFSFPVEEMYPAVGIFSYLAPVRYYFLIYINETLNGFPLYYSRLYYVALIVYPFVGALMLWRLKKTYQKPVYLP